MLDHKPSSFVLISDWKRSQLLPAAFGALVLLLFGLQIKNDVHFQRVSNRQSPGRTASLQPRTHEMNWVGRRDISVIAEKLTGVRRGQGGLGGGWVCWRSAPGRAGSRRRRRGAKDHNQGACIQKKGEKPLSTCRLSFVCCSKERSMSQTEGEPAGGARTGRQTSW
jgi:hypothetical protein